MTANRWWVRTIARWLARIDGVKGQVQMFSLAVTAFSTFSIMLQGFGMGEYVPYIGIGGILSGIIYTYYYTEGGVWNQVGRDRQDLSNNFASPNALITTQISAKAFVAGLQGSELSEEQEEAIESIANAEFESLRDGIELDD